MQILCLWLALLFWVTGIISYYDTLAARQSESCGSAALRRQVDGLSLEIQFQTLTNINLSFMQGRSIKYQCVSLAHLLQCEVLRVGIKTSKLQVKRLWKNL